MRDVSAAVTFRMDYGRHTRPRDGGLVWMFGGAAKDPPGGSFAGFGSIGRGVGLDRNLGHAPGGAPDRMVPWR